MNVQAGQTQESTNESKDVFKVFQGARVKWPPEIPDDMLEAIIVETHSLIKKYNIDDKDQGQQIVSELKKFLEENYEPYWHVVCGRNFGTYVVHEKLRFLHFYIDKYAFLMYKAGY